MRACLPGPPHRPSIFPTTGNLHGMISLPCPVLWQLCLRQQPRHWYFVHICLSHWQSLPTTNSSQDGKSCRRGCVPPAFRMHQRSQQESASRNPFQTLCSEDSHQHSLSMASIAPSEKSGSHRHQPPQRVQ